MKTRVTTLLNIELPIIQGGLAYLAYAELASAVSNAGGLGQITAMSLPSSDALRAEIRKTKNLTSRPFGVNFAIGQHGRSYEEQLETAIEEGVEVISITGGNPAPVLKRLESTSIKKLVLVASKRQAVKAEQLGADAVMVVGQEGGGHIGKEDTGTIVLIPQVAESLSIPVIGSGGIGDGKGLMAALALGAEGIEMGTRFIATKECVHAHPLYKQMIVDSTENDTVVIKKQLGMPGRTLNTPFALKIIKEEKQNPTYENLKNYISGDANKKFIYEGKEDQGFGWAGQVAGRINDIVSVEELFQQIKKEVSIVQLRWNGLF
ncbi:nitronate monooxygenase family protein [Fictibacillus nanhaiensis]|uniref:NAD(P)H-dependent flavin oxidoreductase n=1 Tax=Fictibacillus nanhaiensis TaxID=742169 RepID=UPI001C94CC69|nr:nitronate monooxygenase family protein [Fictibacillus nanhaiensis]MBY6036248.1 nitronate monooxygenase family protein [Fictibacillus nanhaiensis]